MEHSATFAVSHAQYHKGKAHLHAMDEMQPVSWTASDNDLIQVDDTKLSVVRA